MCLQCVSTCVCTYVQYVSVYLRYLTQVTCMAPKFPQFFRAGFRESLRRHLQCDRTPSTDSTEGFTTGCALQTALIPDDVGKFFRILEH